MEILEYNQLCKKYNLERYFMPEELDTEYTEDYVIISPNNKKDCICGYRLNPTTHSPKSFCVYENGEAREWTTSLKKAEKMLIKRINEYKELFKIERINKIKEF